MNAPIRYVNPYGTQGEGDGPRDAVDRVINSLESGRVLRYHAAPTVLPQTNGLHQWGVLVLAIYLTEGNISRELLLECIGHDSGEYFGGDVPFTAKRDNAELKKLHDAIEETARLDEMLLLPESLSPHDGAILKMADTLEGLVWCYKNELRGPVRSRWFGAFKRACIKFQGVLSEDEIQRARDLVNVYS